MTPEQQSTLDRFERGIDAMRAALAGTPEGLLDRSPAPGKWSIRQIVLHVADDDIVAAMRIRQIAAEPGALLLGFDQDRWAQELRYVDQSLELAMETFVLLRRSTAAMLRGLPEAAWSYQGNHEERGLTTLEAFVAHMANHAELHAGQIRRIRGQLGSPAQP
jgi:uncharacterized damage-inducible protein DinB